MPATEQTWRNTRWMHLVFGFTALAMLLVTLWMFADDHNREWKNYQQTFYHDVEVWNLRARQNEQENTQFGAAREARKDEIEDQQESVPSKPLIELFALEQEYFHNRAWLEQDGASLQTSASSAPDKPKATYAVDYAALLNRAQNLLGLETGLAMTTVELNLARADAKGGVLDQQVQADQQQRIKNLEGRRQEQEAAVKKAREQIAKAADDFRGRVTQDSRFVDSPAADRVRDRYADLDKAPADEKRSPRGALVKETDEQIKTARFLEEKKQTEMKFKRADLDVARSDFDLRLGQGADRAERERLQERVESVDAEVKALEAEYASLNRHRKQLDAVLTAATAGETAARKALELHEAEIQRLQEQRRQASSGVGKTLLSMPILDAFYNSPQITLKGVDIWLPKLTIDRNFSKVARFDRCGACHTGILKASPSDPLQPAYERRDPEGKGEELQLPSPQRVVKSKAEVYLQRSDADKQLPAHFRSGSLKEFVGLIGGQPDVAEDEKPKLLPSDFSDDDLAEFVKEVYGVWLAKKGLWKQDEPIVEYIVRRTPAADARLKRGDVITEINHAHVGTRREALRLLAGNDKWGQSLPLKVLRGVPQPYSTHPRLELFGPDTSPHPFPKFGCTICHDGQGNGTAFKWTSHTPNTLSQAEDWARGHNWFDNQHWIYPMRPKRFAESNCLKCHHDLGELERSERFPEPPAPKLMEGYSTIRTYGCFGCHEIKGYDGPNKRIGPDLRLEPNYFAAAEQLRYLGFGNRPPADDSPERELYGKLLDVRNHPEDNSLRRELQQLLRQRPMTPAAAAAADVLKDEEAPGKLRKVGPSLRHVGSKLDDWFIYNQIENPAGFRPTARMPQFFGLHSHFLKGSEALEADEAAAKDGKSTKDKEQVEIRAIVEYLRQKSQPLTLKQTPPSNRLAAPKDAKEPLARGKFLFQTRGCLACHQHSAFPNAKETQGPDLSHVGDKLAGKNGENAPRGRDWLYNWLLDPTNYHARTKMPNTFLVPLKEKNQKDGPDLDVDPALEIAEFLLASKAGAATTWKSSDLPDITRLSAAMRDLAIEHLQGGSGFTRSQALSYLDKGIPAALAPELKGDEIELLQDDKGNFDPAKQLVYLGRRSISKYGCFGCHDVPGFEAAKPIGTGLVEWGRKETSKIAFEQIATYIGKSEPGLAQPEAAADKASDAKAAQSHGEGHELDLSDLGDEDRAYFLNSLVHHQREGFLWQKLRQPRSYDYEKTQNKKYNERLKMPRFRFHPDNPDGSESKENAEVREKVMTFVLGLVSEAPAEEYLYRPDPRRKAIAEGRVVLAKYNCGGCHTLEMEQWKVSLRPTEQFRGIPFFEGTKDYKEDYPFLAPHFSADALERSKREDERGLQSAVLTGMRAIDTNTGNLLRDEIEDAPGKFQIGIELWKPAVINGQVWRAAEMVPVFEENAKLLRPPVGGTLARLLPPVVVQYDQALQAAGLPNASLEKKKIKDAMAFAPPPLVNEGRKAQTTWLHNFLLDPYPIRPMAVLRMPKFNMSADEASILVNYFAAMDSAEYPYSFDARTRQDHLQNEEQRFPGRLDDAKVFVQTICLQCHKLGDFSPTRYDQAPNLADVYHRLRPEFLRHWVANPKRFLPYTGMPDNQIPPPPKGPLDKSKPDQKGNFGAAVGPLFDPSKSHATSEDQLGAVLDFLLNYDRYAQRHEKIEQLKVPEAAKDGAKDKEPAKEPTKKEPAKGKEPEKPKPKGTNG